MNQADVSTAEASKLAEEAMVNALKMLSKPIDDEQVEVKYVDPEMSGDAYGPWIMCIEDHMRPPTKCVLLSELVRGKHKYAYEVLGHGGETWLIPFFDWEEYRDSEEEMVNDKWHVWEKCIARIRKKFGENVNIIGLDACGKKDTSYIISFHVFVRGAGAYKCGKDMIRANIIPEGFDQSIYKEEGSRQLFRMVGMSKAGENRPFRYIVNTVGGGWDSVDVWGLEIEQRKKVIMASLIQYSEGESHVEVKIERQQQAPVLVTEDMAAVGANGMVLGSDILVTKESVRELCMLAGWFTEVNRGFERWRDEMWLLQNTADDFDLDDELDDLMIEVSAVCATKHDDGSVESIKRVTMNRSTQVERKNLGQLRAEVKTMNPDGYFEWAAKWSNAKKLDVAGGDPRKVTILNLVNTELTDADVAEQMINGGWVDDYLWIPDQGKSGTIMKWNGVIWETGSPSILNSQICQTLYNALESHVKKEFNPDRPFACLGKLPRLRSLGSINSIIGQICALKGPAKGIKWNMQEYKLAFTNGVLDLKTGRFEAGRKEDYITQTTGYELPLDVNMCVDELRLSEAGRVSEVKALFDQILPEQAVQGVFWQILGSCLVGRTLEAIPVFTGVGRNGKGLTIQFIKNVLGNELYYTGDNSVLQKEIGTGGINQSLANMGGKRCVVFSEGSADTRFKVSSLKNISGGDEINARGIYSANTNTRLCATNIIDCNEIPPLDKSDAAIDARIKLIPFNSRFLTPQDIAKLPSGTQNVYPVNDCYKKDEWQQPRRVAMLLLMIDGLRRMLDNPTRSFILYNIPKELEDAKRAYIQDSDEVLTWFKTHYHITNVNTDVVAIQDIHTKFKEDPESPYVNYSKSEKRTKGTKKHFVAQLASHAVLSIHYRKEIDVVNNSIRDHRTNVLVGIGVNMVGWEYGDDGKAEMMT